MHSWNTFGAPTNHEQTWTHKTHHGSDLGETTTFPLIVFFMHGHGPNNQTSFCTRTPMLGVPKLELLWLWKLIISYADLLLRWGLKQSCSPCQKNLNDMCQVNKGNPRLLMVKIQISNFTSNPFFSHNLCFKYPNGSCDAILNIYVPRSFEVVQRTF
jgi:hypothetical protein